MANLLDKFIGCIAGSWVGSAMGAPVEGWSFEEIEQRYGTLDRMLPYKHNITYTDWERPPGTTEDGIERQKLIATAIIDKQDRIDCYDLVNTWLRDLDPAKMLFKMEKFDISLLEWARAGVEPTELGRLVPFGDLVTVARSSHPIALINAGDPESAARDTFEVGRVYAPDGSAALRWAALYNAAVAEACREEATVESVLEVAQRYALYRDSRGSRSMYDYIGQQLEWALDLAATHREPQALREAFYRHYYGGEHIPYGASYASEVVTKGLAIFAATHGDPTKAILCAVNFGRDTDCLAAIAGGLAGSLRGAGEIPEEWITQVDEATRQDPYTNNRRTIRETAEGLHAAFVVRLRRLRRYLDEMEGR